MRTLFSVCLAGCVLGTLSSSSTVAQEWTRFRGPNGTGVSECRTIPTQWTEADYRWKSKLPGMGHGSPVVWGDKVFLMSADPETATRYVLCYDATDGRRLWKRDFESHAHHLHLRSSYASCTPAVDGQHVYVAWGTPEQVLLKAFDHSGGEVWSKDLGSWTGQHGFGTSPIVHDDLVILHNSQQAAQLDPGQKPGQSYMLAFRATTGEEVWRTSLNTLRVCYSVPFIHEPENGPEELICTSTGEGFFSLDPRTGGRNWSIPGVFAMRVVNSPIEAGGLMFSSNGSGAYSGNFLVAVRPGENGELAYQLKNSSSIKAPYVTCMLPMGDAVFLIYDRGFAACLNAPTGKIRWGERMQAAFNASPIRIGDKIYSVDEEGVVWVIAADPEQFRVLAKMPLGEPSSSTPAVSGGRLFLRTHSQLFCVGGSETVAAGL